MTTVDLASTLAASAGAPQAHLVTRPVGAAVRLLVERQLDALAAGTVAVLDFSGIGVLDRSCADEFVAKLMLPREGPMPARDGYVMLRGLHDGHLDAIEAVLETHGLALVVQLPDGATRLVGAVTATERRLWEQVMVGAAAIEELAAAVGLAVEEVHAQLEALVSRRLLRRAGSGVAPLGAHAA